MILNEEGRTNINGASQERSSLQGFVNNVEELWVRFAEVVLLSNPPGEVLKALGGAASRESLVASIHSKIKKGC